MAWKLQKCCEVMGVSDGDIKPDDTFFGRKIGEVYLACF